VPNLALEIVRRQRGARGGARRLNLQGFLVGAPPAAPPARRARAARPALSGAAAGQAMRGRTPRSTMAARSTSGGATPWSLTCGPGRARSARAAPPASPTSAACAQETRAGAHRTCNFSSIGPLRSEHGLDVDAKVRGGPHAAWPGCPPRPGGRLACWAAAPCHASRPAQACAKYVARATEEMGAINIYEIYADVCRDWRADADGRQLLRALAGPDAVLRQGAAPDIIGPRALTLASKSRVWIEAGHGRAHAGCCDSGARARAAAGQYDPCIDNEVQAYFNRPDVQAALHANRSQHALPYGPWQGCSTIV